MITTPKNGLHVDKISREGPGRSSWFCIGVFSADHRILLRSLLGEIATTEFSMNTRRTFPIGLAFIFLVGIIYENVPVITNPVRKPCCGGDLPSKIRSVVQRKGNTWEILTLTM